MTTKYIANLNFSADWDRILSTLLVDSGIKIKNQHNDSDAIRQRYFNLKRRLINPIPRQVHFPKDFECPKELSLGLSLVIETMIRGDNLFPHLSKGILDPDYNDPLLNDWGIYHLHLGAKQDFKDQRFIERTEKVLFVYFYKNKALLINLLPHGSWTKQEMVKVLHDNWPEAIKQYKLKNVIGLSQKPSDDEIKFLRKGALNTGLEIEPGVVYMPIGGGITAGNTSFDVQLEIDYFDEMIDNLESYVYERLDEIGDKISHKTGIYTHKLDLHLTLEGKIFYLISPGIAVKFKLHELN